MSNIMQASHEWATRPNDQRFLDLEELHEAVKSRKDESWTASPRVQALRMVVPDEVQGLKVQVYDPVSAADTLLTPSHFSFGQLAGYAKSPAAYLRQLPDQLAAINLQWMLEHSPVRENTMILGQSNSENHLRAMTSVVYGRIWDQQVVEAVQRVNVNGNWKVPSATYSGTDPRRATTLYASDRDVFIFLVDPDHAIDVNGDIFYRGFITWNSEVGASVFGLRTFLYRTVCDNRIIWDATEIAELRIRHTGGAPERFAYEGQKYLTRYANESTAGIVAALKKAKEMDVPLGSDPKIKGGKQTLESWLQDRGFTQSQAKGAVDTAKQDGEPRSLMDIINGVTAFARSIPHTDARVDLEARAGSLMKLAKVEPSTMPSKYVQGGLN